MFFKLLVSGENKDILKLPISNENKVRGYLFYKFNYFQYF